MMHPKNRGLLTPTILISKSILSVCSNIKNKNNVKSRKLDQLKRVT